MVNTRGNQAFIFDVATAGACAVDWQTDFVAKLQELGIKTYNNHNVEFDTSPNAFLKQEIDITSKALTLFGVLLPNYPSIDSATMLSSYIAHFKTMAVLVIPEYIPDQSLWDAANIDKEKSNTKDVNRMRSYLRDQAKAFGAKVFYTIDEAIPAFLLLQTKWAKTIGTFGICGNSDWRKTIIQPWLNDQNVVHYNPQCEPDTWAEWMIEEEEIAKQNSNIILLNLNVVPKEQSTTALVSQIESIRFGLMQNRNIIVIYDPIYDQYIVDNLLSPNLVETFKFSRQTMSNIINNSTNPYMCVVKNFQDAIMCLSSMIESQKALNS